MLTILKSRLTVLVVGAALAFGGISAWNWYNPPKARTIFRVVPTPYVAPESPISKNIERVVLPVNIETQAPTERQRAKLEKKLGWELPKGQPILSIKEIDVLPHGGRGVISLDVGDDGVGRAVLTVYPKPQPFFEWRLDRSVGVYGGVGFGRLAGQVWNVEFEQGLFRVGPAELSARAGLFSSPLGTDGYVMVGGRVRF